MVCSVCTKRGFPPNDSVPPGVFKGPQSPAFRGLSPNDDKIVDKIVDNKASILNIRCQAANDGIKIVAATSGGCSMTDQHASNNRVTTVAHRGSLRL